MSVAESKLGDCERHSFETDNGFRGETPSTPYGAAWVSGASRDPHPGNPVPTADLERPMEDWDGKVHFSPKDERPQRTERGPRGQDPIEYDQENTLRYGGQASDGAPNATVATGLPLQQLRIHIGLKVKAPDGEGSWGEDDNGDAPTVSEKRRRAKIEIALQKADFTQETQDRVLRILEEEDGRAWSYYGGLFAMVVGTVAALGFEEHAELIRGKYDIETSVSRLKKHAEDRKLVMPSHSSNA